MREDSREGGLVINIAFVSGATELGWYWRMSAMICRGVWNCIEEIRRNKKLFRQVEKL